MLSCYNCHSHNHCLPCRIFPQHAGTFPHGDGLVKLSPYTMKKLFCTSMTTYLQSNSEPVTDAVAFFMGNSARVWRSSYTYCSWQDKAMESMRGWRRWVEEGGGDMPKESEVESMDASSEESEYSDTDQSLGDAQDEEDDEMAEALDNIHDGSEVSSEVSVNGDEDESGNDDEEGGEVESIELDS